MCVTEQTRGRVQSPADPSVCMFNVKMSVWTDGFFGVNLMSTLGIILIVILILALCGGGYGYSNNNYSYGHGGMGIVGVVVLVLVLLFIFGRDRL